MGDSSQADGDVRIGREALGTGLEVLGLSAVSLAASRAASALHDVPLGDESHYHRLGLRIADGELAAAGLADSAPLAWAYAACETLLGPLTDLPAFTVVSAGARLLACLALWWCLRPLCGRAGSVLAAVALAASTALVGLDRALPISSTFALGAAALFAALGCASRGRTSSMFVCAAVAVAVRPELGLVLLAAGVALRPWRERRANDVDPSRGPALGLLSFGAVGVILVAAHTELSARAWRAWVSTLDPVVASRSDSVLGVITGDAKALLAHLSETAAALPQGLLALVDLGHWSNAGAHALGAAAVLGLASTQWFRHGLARAHAWPARQPAARALAFGGLVTLPVAWLQDGSGELLLPLAPLVLGSAALALTSLIRRRADQGLSGAVLALVAGAFAWLVPVEPGADRPQTDRLEVVRLAPAEASNLLAPEATQLAAWAGRRDLRPIDLTDATAMSFRIGLDFRELVLTDEVELVLDGPLLRDHADAWPDLATVLDGPDWIELARRGEQRLLARR